MVEKIINLENVSLVDFLGVENSNIKELAQAFPESKIISRGNEIRIKGSGPEIVKINSVINELIEKYHKYSKITSEIVQSTIRSDQTAVSEKAAGELILYGVRGAAIKPRTPNQKKITESATKNDLVFAVGPAGTGKTYVAVAMAVRALKNKEVKRIIITRPAVEAGESLGFLPGDLKEKVDPYLRPIYDALDDMIPAEKLNYYRERNVIEIAPIAYMRGRTLSHAFVLLDEAQNTTALQMKMMLTRLGPNSKMIVTGDRSQVDLPHRQKSGLDEACRALKDIKGVGIVHLKDEDVVRHRLVRNIINAFETHEAAEELRKINLRQEKK